MTYPKNIWEKQNLSKKLPKPITNVFAYNPQKVLTKLKRQTGSSNLIKDSRKKALPPGKRISKSGKVYWETRADHSDLENSNI